MQVRALSRRRLLAVVACGAAFSLAPAASAAPAPPPPTVTVTMTNNAINVGSGNAVRAGTTIYKVVTPYGSHSLQLVRLHSGYSYTQATRDLKQAFNGNVAAIRRADSNITFLGGANTSPGHPGYFSQKLPAGSYYAIDTAGPDPTTATHRRFTVFGSPAQTAPVPSSSNITAFTYGFGTSSSTLPRAGTTFFYNQSDQPHFLVLQQVKQSTTNDQVKRYASSGSQNPPSFALPHGGSDSTGVITPTVGMAWRYNLPPGKYLLACFWPDDENGMPHFNMGMWKLVQLQ